MANPLVNLNSDGTIWNKTAPNGEPLIIGRLYEFKGQWWVYAGDYMSKAEVPNVQCCYTIGDEIHIKSAIQVVPMIVNKVKRRRADDNRPIYTDIQDSDNALMALAKTALREKEITRGDFKELYDNDSDMNNSLRAIETGGNLSWARFTDLCDRLHYSYNLGLKDEQGNPIGLKPAPVAKKRKK